MAVVYVYLIGAERLYKIGISADPEARLKELQTGSATPLKLIHSYESDNPRREEKVWHEYFCNKRLCGEWFRLNRQDVSHFKENQAPFGGILKSEIRPGVPIPKITKAALRRIEIYERLPDDLKVLADDLEKLYQASYSNYPFDKSKPFKETLRHTQYRSLVREYIQWSQYP